MLKIKQFFMSYDSEWESYSLTTNGLIALVILMLIIMIVAAFVVDRKQKTPKLCAKQLAFSGVALALGFITSYIKYEMPFGGSVTLFSMLFICLIGYWYGIKAGMFAAFAYSILQFLQSGGSYFLSPFQVCCDYFFAFTALGITGFFARKKNGLIVGYILAAFIRGLFHTIGGYIYWMDYMPESFPQSLAAIYPIVYNYAYIVTEAVITLIVISLPPVKKALEKVKTLAL